MTTNVPAKPRRYPPKPRYSPPANANITRVFLSLDGAVLIAFDRAVIVDQASPPTTWSVNGLTSFQPGGGFNMLGVTYLILNGFANPGNPVVIGANDPAARTPEGGYVNGGTFTVEDI